MPRLLCLLYLQSPPNAQRCLRISNPYLPKDLRLLYILNSFSSQLRRAQDSPKAVSSRKVSKDTVLEVLVLTAAEDNVYDSLSPLSTATARARYIQDVLIKEEVVKSNLLSLQLHQQHALLLIKPLIELQHLLSRRQCVPIYRAAFLFYLLCADLLSYYLSLTLPSKRRPKQVQLGRQICQLLASAILPLSSGLLSSLISSLVSRYTYVGRDLLDSH